MSDTITDKLAKSLADNVFDTNQQTSATNRIPNIDVLRQMASTPSEPQNTMEKSMHQGLGRSLMRNTGDFLREGAEAFIDTSLFSIPSAFTDWDPSEGADTSAGKWGAGIGGTAGFISPWKLTAKGLGFLTRKGASSLGKITTDDLGKQLDNVVKTATSADKLGKTVKTSDDGVEALRWMAGAKESDNIISTFGKMISHQFKDRIKHWSHLGVQQKDDFTKMINEGFGDSIKRMANAQGIEVSEEAAEQISRRMMKAWDKAGQNPIDNIQSLIAGAFPTSKLASFYGHLFEEAVTFATVDSIMHGMQVAGGKQDADFGAVAKHGFMLGHALGVVRFVPNMGTGEAGVRGGFGSLFNRDGRANWVRLLANSRNYAKKLDPTKENHRDSIGLLYKVFDDLGRIPKESGEHGAASVWRQVKTFMNEWYAKSGNKQYDPGAYTYDHLMHLMKTGSPEQAKNIAQAMQFVLGQVSSQARGAWRPRFLKEWAKDFASATPRMGLGGLVMGSEVIFDENVPLEDKIMTVGIGAFLMRGGKELQYRGADGSHKVIGSLRDFPRNLEI